VVALEADDGGVGESAELARGRHAVAAVGERDL
jgi:hypothetical protein